VDPIADDFPHVSPFNYAENRPVSCIDLHGLQAVDVVQRQYQEGSVGAGVLAGKVKKDDLMPLYKAQAAGAAAGAAVGILGLSVKNIGIRAIFTEVVETVFEEITGVPIINDPIDIGQKGVKEGSEAIGKRVKNRLPD